MIRIDIRVIRNERWRRVILQLTEVTSKLPSGRTRQPLELVRRLKTTPTVPIITVAPHTTLYRCKAKVVLCSADGNGRRETLKSEIETACAIDPGISRIASVARQSDWTNDVFDGNCNPVRVRSLRTYCRPDKRNSVLRLYNKSDRWRVRVERGPVRNLSEIVYLWILLFERLQLSRYRSYETALEIYNLYGRRPISVYLCVFFSSFDRTVKGRCC